MRNVEKHNAAMNEFKAKSLAADVKQNIIDIIGKLNEMHRNVLSVKDLKKVRKIKEQVTLIENHIQGIELLLK